jgi:hypothetical protein
MGNNGWVINKAAYCNFSKKKDFLIYLDPEFIQMIYTIQNIALKAKNAFTIFYV